MLIGRRDIQVLKTYGAAPYAAALKRLEKEIKEKQTSVNEKIGPLLLYVLIFDPCDANTCDRCQGIPLSFVWTTRILIFRRNQIRA